MASFKYTAPLLAAVGFAAAQSSSCSTSATLTVQNGGDATAIASCRTYTGSIALSTAISGPFSLDGIQKIDGSLIGNNVTQLTSFSADSLSEITDTFGLQSMIRLSSLTMPRLSTVKTIDWSALPNLQGLTFNTGVRMAESVMIQNTQLAKLDGINLAQVNELVIANNPLLNAISMQLGNISDQLTINANGKNVVAQFPNLIWAQNMTINNVTTLTLPSLQAVNGSFGMNFNYFTNISAPNLTMVGGSLGFVSNANLQGIDFPQLTEVDGGLLIANNSALNQVNGFTSLKTVGGAFDCTGVFNDIQLPALADVKGAFHVISTQDISKPCSTLKAESGPSSTIKGNFTCKGQSDNPTSADGTVTGSGSAPKTSTSHGAANVLVISGTTGVLGLVAALFGLL